MYSSLSNQNTLLTKYNTFVQQSTNNIPFRNNNLLNQNVNVVNSLHNLVAQKKVNRDTNRSGTAIYGNTSGTIETNTQKKGRNRKENNMNRETNVIESMLRPQKIVKDNKDVNSSYYAKKQNMKSARENAKKGKLEYTILNTPYKPIIRDRIINKKVEEVKREDLQVHKVTQLDKDVNLFETEKQKKVGDREQYEKELKIQFCFENYEKCKEDYELKHSFIKRMEYENKTFDRSKEDYISYYKKTQKDMEQGKKEQDAIIKQTIETGLVRPEELLQNSQIDSQCQIEQISSQSDLSENHLSENLNFRPPTVSAKQMKVNEITEDDLDRLLDLAQGNT